MAEEKVFVRKASGLVRGLSLVDAFGVGFMNIGLTPSMWFMISVGLAVYPGGNLIIATLLGFLLGGIGFPLVWGILGGSMPRSGGEYIYNSRIISPVIGIAESFGNAVVWILWIYTLAPYTVDPGLTMLFGFLGMPQVVEFLRSPWGLFLFSTLVNVVSFLLLAFGVKFFAKAQRVAVGIGIFGTIVLLLVLTFTTRAAFIESWNNLAAQYGSLDYNAFIAAARTAASEQGATIPETWNWRDTIGVMVAGSWLVVYAYAVTFIAGEVKRPDRTLIGGTFFAILVPAIFMLWCATALYRLGGFEFITAASWVDGALGGELPGYTLPWSPHFFGLAAVITQNPIILSIIAISFIAFSIWFVALSYLAFPRILFAWGMDRMGPKWFTDLNPRYSMPFKTMALCFVLSEIGIAIFTLLQGGYVIGLSVTGMEVVSVFAVTAIAAVLFPYRKKVRHIWEASPYKNWRILGVPLVTIGGVVTLIYLAIVGYGFLFSPLEGLTLGSSIVYLTVWALGIAWYFIWKARGKRAGIDVSMAYGELPPD